MGTILHEGEYILISKKITNEAYCFGYDILSHIGINTSKVNFLGSTKHFCTYAVIKDLVLPFNTTEWQDFEVRSVRFHAHTHNFKNLILLERDECGLDYFDEVDDFFEKEKKKNKSMAIEANNYIYIATNTAGFSDYELMTALLGCAPTYKDERIYTSSYLWSRNKLLVAAVFDVIDAKTRLSHLSEKLDFFRTTKGDVIIYRDVNNGALEILKAYHGYRDNNSTEKEKEKRTTLKKGEYVLVSKKIIEETALRGYGVLVDIGIDIDKLTCARTDNTKHFLTYEVTEDLELPFDNHGWQEFTIKDTTFHPYHKSGRHLFLLHHDEASLVFSDEIDAFISKEKEKKNMLNNNTFSISNNPAWANKIDDVIFADNRAYMAATPLSVPDKLPDITLEDLTIESSVRTEPLIRGTFRVSPGIVRETGKFQFTQYVGYKQLFDGGYINNTKQLLNSIYGLNGGLSIKKPPFKFKLKFGIEHATGRYKTICLWEDGEKTIICGDNKVTKLPVAQAFAWCYVKRTFRTVSQFKKHVDKRTTKMDGVWYFEGDCLVDEYAQGSVPGTSKKRDIYDAAALAIVTKRYGGLRKLVDEYINKKENK